MPFQTLMQVTVTIRDAKKRRSRFSWYEAINEDIYGHGLGEIGDMKGNIQVLLETLDLEIGGAIESVSITHTYKPQGTLKATADSNSDVEEGLKVEYGYATPSPSRNFCHVIPTYKHEVLDTLGDGLTLVSPDTAFTSKLTYLRPDFNLESGEVYNRYKDRIDRPLEAWRVFKR